MGTEVLNYIAVFTELEKAIEYTKYLKSKSPKSKFRIVEYKSRYYIQYSKPSTSRQKAAVKFCMSMMDMDVCPINIDDFDQCSSFLDKHLDYCKGVYSELLAEYSSYYWEKL